MTTMHATTFSNDRSDPNVTLAELDASIGTGPSVSEDEVAVCYYSDEAFLTAIRLRRSGQSAD